MYACVCYALCNALCLLPFVVMHYRLADHVRFIAYDKSFHE